MADEDIRLALGSDIDRLEEEKANVIYVDDAIKKLPTKHMGEDPDINEIMETGYYSYTDLKGEKDLLIVHNYPNRYVVQYRLTANSLDRRYRPNGGGNYNEWQSIGNVNFGNSEFVEYVSGGVNNVCAALDDLYQSKIGVREYASVDKAGIIRLHKRGDGTNISGLVVDKNNGGTYVNTNSDYGITRTGDGKVVVSAASKNDIDEKANNYKPIVPATLSTAVQSVTGHLSNLKTVDKSSIVAAINELWVKINEK